MYKETYGSWWRKGKEFVVWGECWPQTVKSLPDTYKNKERIIRIKRHLSSPGQIKMLRQEGALNLQVFLKYRREWNLISMIPKRQLFWMSIRPRLINALKWEHEKRAFADLPKRFERKKNKILSACKGKTVVIYGAGQMGERLRQMLSQENITPGYWAVTKTVIRDEILRSLPVKSISDFDGQRDEFCFLGAAVPRVQKELKDYLKQTDWNGDVICV